MLENQVENIYKKAKNILILKIFREKSFGNILLLRRRRYKMKEKPKILIILI